MFKQIGTVEILRLRIYPLDPLSKLSDGTDVAVQPGEYPLYSDGFSYFWFMSGKVNTGGFNRMGDGLFTMKPGDDYDESMPDVHFPSRTFGPDEWESLMQDEDFLSRVRINIDSGSDLEHRDTEREDTDPEHVTELG